jgi:hypothetical protein
MFEQISYVFALGRKFHELDSLGHDVDGGSNRSFEDSLEDSLLNLLKFEDSLGDLFEDPSEDLLKLGDLLNLLKLEDLFEDSFEDCLRVR